MTAQTRAALFALSLAILMPDRAEACSANSGACPAASSDIAGCQDYLNRPLRSRCIDPCAVRCQELLHPPAEKTPAQKKEDCAAKIKKYSESLKTPRSQVCDPEMAPPSEDDGRKDSYSFLPIIPLPKKENIAYYREKLPYHLQASGSLTVNVAYRQAANDSVARFLATSKEYRKSLKDLCQAQKALGSQLPEVTEGSYEQWGKTAEAAEASVGNYLTKLDAAQKSLDDKMDESFRAIQKSLPRLQNPGPIERNFGIEYWANWNAGRTSGEPTGKLLGPHVHLLKRETEEFTAYQRQLQRLKNTVNECSKLMQSME